MFGPGFVWLVKSMERTGYLHILCTYNAGSPYPSAHARRQSVDMNTQPNDPAAAALDGQYNTNSMWNSHLNSTPAPGSIPVNPILCVNTWEHVWLMDYGIAGKAEYLERWWDRINWEVVLDNYNLMGAKAVSGSPESRMSRRMM